MYPNLEKYLDEISHYLVLRHGTEDVLAEIKSHILEKTSQEHGTVSEENLEKVIAHYGSPRRVAGRYVEGQALIAPTLKKYLLRYTAIVFAIHLAITLIALFSKSRLVVFPFLYIPRMTSPIDLFYLPTALIYDLGLVGIFLYFVTQAKEEMRLPWFHIRFHLPRIPEAEMTKPKIHLLVLMLAGLAMVAAVYVRFQTLFIFGVSPEGPQSLFRPSVSHWYSLAIIALMAVGVGGYAALFYFRPEWVEVVKNAICLLIAGIINIYPLESEPSRLPFLSERAFGTLFVVVVVLSSAIGLIKNLFLVSRRLLSVYTHAASGTVPHAPDARPVAHENGRGIVA